MLKGSTQSADLFLRDWVICRLPGRNSRSRALRSPFVARGATESRKSCSRKPQTHLRKPHDGRHHYHCLLLDHLVFVQRNRKWPAFDRSSEIATKREAPRTGCFAVESPPQASGTLVGYRSAR